ncbi:MAG: L-fucose/L-arabinose isomerase family protein [Pirellulales bacterium]|nr:L-fucose/L-arabinose isomerase family protein [Pirellulales bacterium]
MSPLTFGVIVGNRGFFPDSLVRDGRQQLLDVLAKDGFQHVALTPEDTKFGAVETYADAKKCAEVFSQHRGYIDGIIVTLPNFGDEKGIAETVKSADLGVPILIHAEPDDPGRMAVEHRRDSFCGKISACNNLRQAGIPYSLTGRHTVGAATEDFRRDLQRFAAVCRVVRGMKRVRLGAVGARTGAFNTVRYSEKILEAHGIAVETIDLSEVLGQIQKLADADPAVQEKLQTLKQYVAVPDVPDEALLKMAKFAAVVNRWADELDLQGTAVQCWTALQEFFGIMPCTVMSMMSEGLRPSACEVDVTGVLGMYVLQLASQSPGALLDWNNNYGDDPDKCVVFHCSNLPRSFFEKPQMEYSQIIAGALGKDRCWGTMCGKIKRGPATFCRLDTDDLEGTIRGYVAEGDFTDDPLNSFGGVGVLAINRLQQLLEHICLRGFEHHVAASFSHVAAAVHEALTRYCGWDIHWHR